MKKNPSKHPDSSDEMRPEYDFSKGVRGKYAQRFREGTNVVVLDPDVAAEFKDGVLNVRLPKAETVKPRAIAVKVA